MTDGRRTAATELACAATGRIPSRALPLHRLLLACAIVCAPTTATAARLTREPDAVGALLHATRDAGLDAEELGARLEALGLDSLPRLFEVLSDGRYEVRVGERGNAVVRLRSSEEEAILSAFAGHPHHAVRELLGELEPDGEQDTVTAIRVVGAIGAEDELRLLFELAAPAEGTRLAKASVRDAFQAALQRMLGRGPRTLEQLVVVAAEAHPSFHYPIVRATALDPTHAKLDALSELAERLPGVRRLALAEVGRIGRELAHPIDDDVRSRTRRYLRDGDPALVTEAVLAVHSLDDADSIPQLIELLRGSDANVREKAVDALEAMTSRQFGPDAEVWSRWYAGELDWWARQAPADFATIDSGPPGLASRVILEVSKKRCFRHRLVEPLARSLSRKQQDLVVLGCAALGHLGSHAAVPHLVRCLDESASVDVRRSAWRALQRITGEELGPEPGPWRELLEARAEPR